MGLRGPHDETNRRAACGRRGNVCALVRMRALVRACAHVRMCACAHVCVCACARVCATHVRAGRVMGGRPVGRRVHVPCGRSPPAQTSSSLSPWAAALPFPAQDGPPPPRTSLGIAGAGGGGEGRRMVGMTENGGGGAAGLSGDYVAHRASPSFYPSPRRATTSRAWGRFASLVRPWHASPSPAPTAPTPARASSRRARALPHRRYPATRRCPPS